MNNSGNVLLALIGGVVIGAGVGVLFAPDKGFKTRRKIRDGFDKSKDDLLEKYHDLVGMLKEKAADATSDLDEILESVISEGKHKSEDVISILENKLAALKKSLK